MNVKIDLLTSDAVSETLALEKRCFENGAFTEGMFVGGIENTNSLYLTAAEYGTGKIIGYIGFWTAADIAEIDSVAVLPEYRRHGAARALLEVLNGICKKLGIGYINLEVRESNIGAARLYEKCGYRRVGRRKGYYEDNEDAILYTLELG